MQVDNWAICQTFCQSGAFGDCKAWLFDKSQRWKLSSVDIVAIKVLWVRKTNSFLSLCSLYDSADQVCTRSYTPRWVKIWKQKSYKVKSKLIFLTIWQLLLHLWVVRFHILSRIQWSWPCWLWGWPTQYRWQNPIRISEWFWYPKKYFVNWHQVMWIGNRLQPAFCR